MADRFCNICPNYWECGGRRWETACQLNPENWQEEAAAPPWPKINPYIDDKTESGLLEED